jgi:hypothetical protein
LNLLFCCDIWISGAEGKLATGEVHPELAGASERC